MSLSALARLVVSLTLRMQGLAGQEKDSMNVRRVVIVGTSHNYQIPPISLAATEFRAFLGGISNTHLVRAIAEEMSREALANWHVTSSLCHELAIAAGVPHRYCDLNEAQRSAAGVRHEHEIKVVGFFSRWSTEKIEQEVRASHSIRERHWMKELLDLDNWPVSNHPHRVLAEPGSDNAVRALLAARIVHHHCGASRLPSFSDGPESIGKDREFGEHRGEPFDQRQQSHLRHCGDQFVKHAALPE